MLKSPTASVSLSVFLNRKLATNNILGRGSVKVWFFFLISSSTFSIIINIHLCMDIFDDIGQEDMFCIDWWNSKGWGRKL